jgi:GT2 family glycosyltransferase
MGAWRREVFERIGGFDEELVRNQDDEFNYRLRAAGGKILLSPAIKSRYYNRSSIRGLWRQYYQYGFYKVRVMQKNLRQMRPRQFAPLALVLVVVGGAVAAPFNTTIRLGWYLVCGLYIAANLAASTITSRKAERRFDFRLPLIFSVLHFSYGLGFLAGLIRFANRWRNDD